MDTKECVADHSLRDTVLCKVTKHPCSISFLTGIFSRIEKHKLLLCSKMFKERCCIGRWRCWVYLNREKSIGIGHETSVSLSFVLYISNWCKLSTTMLKVLLSLFNPIIIKVKRTTWWWWLWVDFKWVDGKFFWV